MQIVIDIPDNEYTLVKNREDFYVDRDNIVSYVRNGKPLPKGHGRLIDADKLIDSLGGSDRDIYCKAVIEEDAQTII